MPHFLITFCVLLRSKAVSLFRIFDIARAPSSKIAWYCVCVTLSKNEKCNVIYYIVTAFMYAILLFCACLP